MIAPSVNPMRVFILTFAALIAFAANSLLCRAALRGTNIDAATFTFVRICSGAVALSILTTLRPARVRHGNWASAAALFAYAAAFSLAYLSLPAGTGALLLFGAVQATMILWGWRNSERLRTAQFVGLVLACAGLVLLVFPGISAPPFLGSILMVSAGVAWGIYSIRGRRTGDAIGATAGNFLRAVVFALAFAIAAIPWLRFDRAGLMYAVVSGAIASGLGYAIWYTVLPALKATSAATVQLSVPVLAAIGGIILLNEQLSARFVIAAMAVLGGIALVVFERRKTRASM
jgi:drug/metabolite transporter (DMT)-like permease